MLGNGVAAHIAFLGLNGLLAPFDMQPPQLLAWTLPLAMAMIAGVWLDRRYGSRRPGPRNGPAEELRLKM